ncbi:hypothetical protein EMEDMD4_620070 [Sinorhizobium medicae]|uniref:Uncharacterized protein n=1 Tax=Sinorhizobium medicae TaxID=110321 RepID=A0A508X429_9HYPH|nr:hypothetical protein EMEDMD4_620070 [Sinorhizobium medicae]
MPRAALNPFLRRHDPDQVQGSGSTPSQHRPVLPSESAIYEVRQRHVNATSQTLLRLALPAGRVVFSADRQTTMRLFLL